MSADYPTPEPHLSLAARIEERNLGGCLPEGGGHGPKTKIGRLEAAGWKLLPIPSFWVANGAWHDPKTGKGNPAFIDFDYVREWLIVPPDEDVRAFKVAGRVCAIREAWNLMCVGVGIPRQ